MVDGSRRHWPALLIVVLGTTLLGCRGGSSGGNTASPVAQTQTASAATSANTAPHLTGAPATAAAANNEYVFAPTASDADGDTLSFAITNKPAWASFDTVNGRLSGTPAAANVGTFADITISVSDGRQSIALPAFAIEVALPASKGVTLSWSSPTQNIDGSALTDLAGFVVVYGNSPDTLHRWIRIDNPSVDRYVFDDLLAGTYYFGVKAISASGEESEMSGLVSKEVG